MARIFRFYQKKRGHRRTGSKTLGSIGEALFFGAFICVGLAGSLFMLFRFVIPEWRANRQFVEATCTVVDTSLGRKPADGQPMFRPDIHIRYKIKSRTYDDVTYDATRMYLINEAEARAILDEYQAGKQYPCWYDPMNPSKAVLVRGYSPFVYLVLLIPISFMVIGGAGFTYTCFHWSTSAERRATLSQKAAQIDLFEQEPGGHDFPGIPKDANLTNSPGTTLRYRLPIASAPGWALFALLVACLVWNGVVSFFAVRAIQSHFDGQPDWVLTVFVIPFVMIGLGLIVYLVRQLVATAGVGATRVEISNHPLHPDGQYEIFVSQAGRLNVNSFEVALVCDEKATYRQGTDTRAESCRVYEEQIFYREGFETHPGTPFENRCPLRIPAEAMHSFKADHNEINWKLIVRGCVEGWPQYERTFPIVVYPQTSANVAG